jgi:hypothetical protein
MRSTVAVTPGAAAEAGPIRAAQETRIPTRADTLGKVAGRMTRIK